MKLQEKIGKRIRSLREEKKLKQEELAWQANLDRTYMNHVENGKRNITLGSLEKILVALGVSFESFFTGFDKEQ